MTRSNPDGPIKSHKKTLRAPARHRRHLAEDAKAQAWSKEGEAQMVRERRDLMQHVLLGALPADGRGVRFGSLLEAARDGTSRRRFPGDTHRMVAMDVLNDLAANGVVRQDDLSLWHRAA